MEMHPYSIVSLRKLDECEVDEEYWENSIEEVDFLERDRCLVM